MEKAQKNLVNKTLYFKDCHYKSQTCYGTNSNKCLTYYEN